MKYFAESIGICGAGVHLVDQDRAIAINDSPDEVPVIPIVFLGIHGVDEDAWV